MSERVTSARLIDALATTEELAEVFSDHSTLKALLDFEVALARAQARLAIIPPQAARAIEAAANAIASNEIAFDIAALTRATLRAGTPAIPVVKALTERVLASDSESARFVHWGATSQDAADTALILLLKRARGLLGEDHARLERALAGLSERYQDAAMLGRTLLQPAPPVTFGLKAAGWLGAIRRGRLRLDAAFEDALTVQFGGASGTLAALGERGVVVGRELAAELGLAYPDAPWHTHRDRLAALMAACGVLTGSLGKMARDVALLMQGEVAEAAEPGGEGRGGSSSMPHKTNPIACSVTLAAAHRVPGLVAAFLSSMVQEHERGVGGWQAEWPTAAAIVQAAGLALASMSEAAAGMSVNTARMRANIAATGGVIFAERAAMLLAPEIGRDAAHRLLAEAARKSVAEGRGFAEVLSENPEIAGRLSHEIVSGLEAPEAYLGETRKLVARLLSPHPNPKEER